MVSSEISYSDLSEYTPFQIKKIIVIHNNQFLCENVKNYVFFAVFLKFSHPKFSDYTIAKLLYKLFDTILMVVSEK